MRGEYLVGFPSKSREPNIYADKSSLVLVWLLTHGIDQQWFSIREVAREASLSPGLVHSVFKALVLQGILTTEGSRTAKQFTLKQPHLLMGNWISRYNLVQKCKLHTYASGLTGRTQLLDALDNLSTKDQIALALHSAAAAYECSNTNLQTLELYVMSPRVISELTATLALEPREKGYDVLLIEPYYKSLLEQDIRAEEIGRANAILTFLDLYHFPLRGREQAEALARKIPELGQIIPKETRG